MWRLLLILPVLGLCVGCAAKTPEPQSDSPFAPPAGPAGTLRVLVGEGLSEAALIRCTVAAPLLDPGPARPLESPPEGAGCRRYEVVGDRIRSGGEPGTAARLAAELERALRRGGPAARWLLSPVVGLDPLLGDGDTGSIGVRANGAELEICTWRAAPDLTDRLAHPLLWLAPATAAGAAVDRLGPFAVDESGEIVAARNDGPPVSRLARIRAVPDQGSPALLLRLGEADMGIVWGADVEALEGDDSPGFRTERLPGWDRTYFLWFGSTGRWTGDPTFRRWVAGLLDREAMVRVLFGGQGAPAGGLLPSNGRPSSLPASGPRPFSAETRPRLVLGHDGSDPWAARVASRLREVLLLAGVDLRVSAADRGRNGLATGFGDADILLHAHSPGAADPVLGLGETLVRLPALPASALEDLEVASWVGDSAARSRKAHAVEDSLMLSARLVPLVRLHAWLAADPHLRGVRTGPRGVLRLEHAWWDR